MESSLLQNLQNDGKMDVKYDIRTNLVWEPKGVSLEEGVHRLKSDV